MRNTDFILNIYEKKSSLSKLASQLLYGETFTIQKNYTNCKHYILYDLSPQGLTYRV